MLFVKYNLYFQNKPFLYKYFSITQQQIQLMDCKVVQNYIITPVVLGKGCFGTVYRGYLKDNTNELLAVKTMELDKFQTDEQIRHEIDILMKLKSPNIVKFYKPVKTKHNIYFFLEYCQTDLKEYLKAKGGILSQIEVLDIIAQICNGFKVVHKNNIIHRDIKPANLLLHNGVVKIADFGFAKVVESLIDCSEHTLLGSPAYMAPQILANKKFSSKCDIWSLGVSLYELLYGKVPYMGGNQTELLEIIKTTPLSFPESMVRSNDIKDLLTRMLVFDEEKRISWAQLFQHPIVNRKEIDIAVSTDPLEQSFQQSKAYIQRNKVLSQTINCQMGQHMEDPSNNEENSENDFGNEMKLQDQKLQWHKEIENIDSKMRYHRNISVFLSLQSNQFFMVAQDKMPKIVFYVGLFCLLEHQVNISQKLVSILNHQHPPQLSIRSQIWKLYRSSPTYTRLSTMANRDLKHLVKYIKQVSNKLQKLLKGDRSQVHEFDELITQFQQRFQHKQFLKSQYILIMKPIILQLNKKIGENRNFITKLLISLDPFNYIHQTIDLGLFYQRQNQELDKLRALFTDI